MTPIPPDSNWNLVDGPFTHNGKKVCHCVCNCGRESLVNEYDLISGKSKGCRACGSKKAWSKTKKKLPNVDQIVLEKIRGAVDNAIARCTDSKHKRYSDWGGRGIKVNFSSRESFIEYLFTLPGHDNPLLVIDRIDNDKHYEIGNLRWVTRSESQRNRRIQGGDLAYYLNHRFAQCFKRLHDKGMSFEQVGNLYCANPSTVRNCVRELEGTR